MNSIRSISLLLLRLACACPSPAHARPRRQRRRLTATFRYLFSCSTGRESMRRSGTRLLPTPETYGFTESLVRVGVAQHIKKWDWQLELASPADLDLPTDAVSPVTAQGQLGLGGTYYASNTNNSNPAAAFLKQGFARYHFAGKDNTLRLGRFEFFDGQETQPKNAGIAWLQTNRIAHRLIGNFGFSTAQRSFDGAEAHFGSGSYDITAMAARADQGVFNMNGNPELNVDLQYLAFTKSGIQRSSAGARVRNGLPRRPHWPYQDGQSRSSPSALLTTRTSASAHTAVTQSRPLLSARAARDLLFWGALQTGQWGALSHSAGAAAVEGGSNSPRCPPPHGCAEDGSAPRATTMRPTASTIPFSRCCLLRASTLSFPSTT